MKLFHRLRHLRTGAALVAPILVVAALAGCGASGTGANASAAATAAPTCPPAPNFKTVTGSIASVGTNSITVTGASGITTPVTLSSSTVITLTATGTPADLTAGTPVQVVTDTNATTAQRIRILPDGTGGGAGIGGFGGFGGRGANATPPAGVNAACARRGRGAGAGVGGAGTGAGGQGAGTGTSAGTGFQGLRGTVDSATSTHLVFDDTQGQTFSVSITSATVITKTSIAKASDLHTGMKVMVIGVASSGGISARAITVQGAATA